MEGLQAGDPVAYLSQNPARTAETILSVTDARIQISGGVVRSSYNKLRNSVKGDVRSRRSRTGQNHWRPCSGHPG